MLNKPLKTCQNVQDPRILMHSVNAIQSLEDLMDSTEVEEDKKEDISSIKDERYRELLRKYPDLLVRTFKAETSKNNILHSIDTGTEKPCRAQVRRLLPGSERAIKGHQAWRQLERLGIVEKVDPAKPNTWSSALHFAPKPNGEIRPVGDYRQ